MGRWKTSEKCIEYRNRVVCWQFFRRAFNSYWSLGVSWNARQKIFTINLFRWEMNFIMVFMKKYNNVD